MSILRNKGLYVSEIKGVSGEGRGIFLLSKKEVSSAKSGGLYMRLLLRDKTGSIEGVLWDAKDSDLSVNEGSFVEVFFEKRVFRDRDQLRVLSIEEVSSDEVREEWFLRRSDKSPEWMRDKLFQFIASVKNRFLRELLESIFRDEEIFRLFSRSPASSSFHHSFIGGLLEHTLSVVTILDFVCSHYRGLNRDLLITAGILHDIGKIWELSQEGEFGYTDTGSLLGHVYMGARFVELKANTIEGFPDDLRDVLVHVILSHHGEYEFGSPKRPKTLEALVLHFVDNMDAKVNGVRDSLESSRDGSSWTEYIRIMGRRFYSKELDSPDKKLI